MAGRIARVRPQEVRLGWGSSKRACIRSWDWSSKKVKGSQETTSDWLNQVAAKGQARFKSEDLIFGH